MSVAHSRMATWLLSFRRCSRTHPATRVGDLRDAVQFACFKALIGMVQCEADAVRAAEAGALEAVMSALRTCDAVLDEAGNDPMQREGMCALQALLRTTPLRLRASALGVTDVIVSSLRAHAADGELVAYGTSAHLHQ
jgi:hypothetical protein